ncbi:MAG: hypothetical protein PHP45_10950 [Elusimicrobiales bacterium]|nr:hypothetical protein [Elusimicrobiales bacterium]
MTLISHLERNRDFIERFRAGQFADSRAHKKFSAARAENLGRITRIIRLCSEGGLLDSRDASCEASALFGLCRSGMMNNLITGRALTVEDRADRVLNILLNGIGKK